MKQFISFVIKESRHILRDKRTMLILFGMPVVLMLIFGFAITTDVRNVRTIVVTSQMNPQIQAAVERLAASEYFTITTTVPTPKDAELLIRNQKADLAIVFSKDHAIQFIVDGADPNMAQQWTNYATGVMMNMQGTLVNSKMLYNPQMRSAYNFVPAIMGMLLMLVCAMMTSISIVREKERGTMEVLLVSPIRPLMIIIAKAVPYLVLAFAILITILLMARSLCAQCAATGLIGVDLRGEYYLYPARPLVGPAHLKHRHKSVDGTADLGDGALDAHCDALRYAVSYRIDAHHPTMAIGHRTAPLLHRGHAQTDDYGCWHPGGHS